MYSSCFVTKLLYASLTSFKASLTSLSGLPKSSRLVNFFPHLVRAAFDFSSTVGPRDKLVLDARGVNNGNRVKGSEEDTKERESSSH